jgi:hypothetical protein
LDFRFDLGFTSPSLSDSSFLATFFAFFALLSFARIDLASFSAFFSIDAFCLASFDVSGSSSSSEDSSPKAAAVTLGGSFPGFFLAASGMSSSESESAFLETF